MLQLAYLGVSAVVVSASWALPPAPREQMPPSVSVLVYTSVRCVGVHWLVIVPAPREQMPPLVCRCVRWFVVRSLVVVPTPREPCLSPLGLMSAAWLLLQPATSNTSVRFSWYVHCFGVCGMVAIPAPPRKIPTSMYGGVRCVVVAPTHRERCLRLLVLVSFVCSARSLP